jgi:hypothetical protein
MQNKLNNNNITIIEKINSLHFWLEPESVIKIIGIDEEDENFLKFECLYDASGEGNEGLGWFERGQNDPDWDGFINDVLNNKGE